MSGMTSDANVEFSVSTWQQPMPPAPSPERARVLDRLVEMIDSLGDHRLRIAIDGLTAAGKTSLGHELAHGLARRGRPALRASLDDFKRPWSERHLYDRVSGRGYYRNAFDPEAARRPSPRTVRPGGRRARGAVQHRSAHPGRSLGGQDGDAPERRAHRRRRCSRADPRSTPTGISGCGSRSTRSSRSVGVWSATPVEGGQRRPRHSTETGTWSVSCSTSTRSIHARSSRSSSTTPTSTGRDSFVPPADLTARRSLNRLESKSRGRARRASSIGVRKCGSFLRTLAVLQSTSMS